MNIKSGLSLIAKLCVIQILLLTVFHYRSFHGIIDDSHNSNDNINSNDKGEERSFHHQQRLRAYNERLLAHVGNTTSTTTTATPTVSTTSTTTTTPRPYYSYGKQFGEIPPPNAPYRQHRLFQKRLLQHNNSSIVNVSSHQDSWLLVDPMTHPFRNHDSLLLEYTTARTTTNNSANSGSQEHEHAKEEDHYILLNILGRHSRYVQAMDLLTGKRWDHTITDYDDTNANKDPAGMPLNDLNHIQTVLVDSVPISIPVLDPSSTSTGTQTNNTQTNTNTTNTKKEIWLPCGFQGDKIDFETSIQYARIVDLETLQIRTGPRLPYPGGACVALPMTILPNEPPMICSFAGTNGTHDSGQFVDTTTCYDRVRQKFWFPFGRLPFGLDHGSISFIPKGTCHESDPAKLIILNFRTQAYGTQRTGEMLGFDVPENGWTLDQLQSDRYRIQETGNWYIFANISYAHHDDDPQDFRLNAPRDASGTLSANNGRNILNFGGAHYHEDPTNKRVKSVFSVIRSFDVCTPNKRWSLVGDLKLPTFALQTVASQKLQLAITCGGDVTGTKDRNNPWCVVNRFHSNQQQQQQQKRQLPLDNRHASPAMTGFSNDFWLDKFE